LRNKKKRRLGEYITYFSLLNLYLRFSTFFHEAQKNEPLPSPTRVAMLQVDVPFSMPPFPDCRLVAGSWSEPLYTWKSQAGFLRQDTSYESETYTMTALFLRPCRFGTGDMLSDFSMTCAHDA
jgi:hypothetical protein